MLLHESATSYFGIANAYIHCGRITNQTKRRQIWPNQREAPVWVSWRTEVTATEKTGCAVQNQKKMSETFVFLAQLYYFCS